jgi:uncharacterized membrane protein HdeD (DUF308 family)
VESPSRKDRTRPAELLVFAGILAIFVGLVVLLATRAPILALVAFGIVFIVSLVILAMLTLTVRPPKNGDGSESDAEEPGDDH